MSARRRARESVPEGAVPEALRRFRAEQWMGEGPEGDWVDRSLAAHERWEAARAAWAAENGFDLAARFGEKPGRDWWAFHAACA